LSKLAQSIDGISYLYGLAVISNLCFHYSVYEKACTECQSSLSDMQFAVAVCPLRVY